MTTDITRHKIFRKSSKCDHPKFLEATVLLWNFQIVTPFINIHKLKTFRNQ